MKILFTGNSQASCLKKALDESSQEFCPELKKADWIVVPGGWGPNLSLNGNHIEVDSFDPRYPPRYSPTQDVLENSVNDYDCIVVTALGYLDGGHVYKSPIVTIENISPGGLEVCADNREVIPISQSCFFDIASHKYDPGMIGFRFVRQLRRQFKGRILIQPFPLLSEAILSHPGWHLSRIYKDPIAANKFMLDIKDSYLSRFCRDHECDLLPYPCLEWRKAGFTPRDYIEDYDYLHPKSSYGALVLGQIHAFIQGINSMD